MSRTLAILGFAGVAYSIAFAAPQPTPAEDDHARGIFGWSPKPTEAPLNLFGRDIAGYRTCGWYDDGFGTQTITCPSGTCMLYTPSGIVGMAGCCTSSAGGMDYQNCGWVNKCYDYLDVAAGQCDSDCMVNDFIRVCTDTDYPFCQSWTYPGPAVRDYGCGTDAASTWITVTSDVSDYIDGTETAKVPFVPAKATITGWNGAVSGTKGASATGTDTDLSSDATGTSLSSSSSSTKTTVALVPIIIIIVVLLLALCGGGAIVAWFCVRSKRNVAKWNTPSTVSGAAVASQHTAPLMQNQPTNVVPPSGAYGGQQSYIDQQGASQHGAASDYYSGREQKTPAVSSMQNFGTPSAPGTPAPPYSQPYMAAQPPMPHMAPQYASQQPYGQQYPPQNGAVEAPANSASRPQYAELG